jgi:hypothetical protein
MQLQQKHCHGFSRFCNGILVVHIIKKKKEKEKKTMLQESNSWVGSSYHSALVHITLNGKKATHLSLTHWLLL